MTKRFTHPSGPFRSGSPSPCVPPGSRVYAIGDIHGRLDLYDRLMDLVAHDLETGGRPARAVVVCLGDLVDRGADSKAVVERMIAGPPAAGPLAGVQLIALRGNHEDHMTEFLADFSTAPIWLRYGGLETIRSYLGDVPTPLLSDFPQLRRVLYAAIPPDHLRFLARIPVRHVEGDYLFVHAGIRPGVALDRQDAYDLMWIREPFLSSTEPAAKMVVHGHTIVPRPEVHPNRIAIDTGAYRSGRLTCLVLEGDSHRFLST